MVSTFHKGFIMKFDLRIAALCAMAATGLVVLSACKGPITSAAQIGHFCPPTPIFCRLFVANYSGNDVAAYDTDLSNPRPGIVTTDAAPVGIAANNKYVVTDRVTGSVTAFAWPLTNTSTPVATFGTSAGGFMAFDPNGNLWATSQNAVVVEYVPPFTNSTVESNGLTDGITDSYGIAFDSGGDMFISNADSSGTIVMYPAPYTTLGTTITVPDTNPGLHGLAVSGSQLFVADTRNNRILVYNLPLGGNVPSVTFTTTAPLGLTVDTHGNLYITEQGHDKIDVFTPPFSNSSSPARSITSGLSGAFGLSFF